MNVTRRSFLRFCGGATAGAMLSPLPWKLLDDVSIWTQNWSWTPKPLRGPVSWRHGTCGLCPRSCGLKLRLIGDRVVSAWGVPGHPLGEGPCPAGLGIAQLAYHPTRIRGAATRTRGTDEPWRLTERDEALAGVARTLASLRERGAADRVAIFDARPDRALSLLYRRFLADLGGGRYLTPAAGSAEATAAYADLFETDGGVPGYDLERAGAVIAFGALPDGPTAPDARLLVAATNGSRDTDRAHRWLALAPGTEAALALGLIHVLQTEARDRALPWPLPQGPGVWPWPGFAELVARHAPDAVARVTGVAPATLRDAAWDLIRHRPAVAVGGGASGGGPLGRAEERVLWALNLALEAPGRPGVVVTRPSVAALFGEEEPPSAASLHDVPDGSLDLLLVDGAPTADAPTAELMHRKMSGPDARIVAFSPFAAGVAAAADLLIPIAAPGEWSDDAPPAPAAGRASYARVPALQTTFDWALHPADALAAVARGADLPGDWRDGRARHEAVLRRRVGILADRGAGSLFLADEGRSVAPGDPGRLERRLDEGACWVDGPASDVAPPRPRDDASWVAELEATAAGRLAANADAARPLVLVPEAAPIVGGVLPPVVNKLYRESNLMRGPSTARVNPETASKLGLARGARARLETRHGVMDVTVATDASVRPGVVAVAVGPAADLLGDPSTGSLGAAELCGASVNRVWRTERASLREA